MDPKAAQHQSELEEEDTAAITSDGETVCVPKRCCTILLDHVRIARSDLAPFFHEEARRILLEQLHEELWARIMGAQQGDLLTGRLGELLMLLNQPERDRPRTEATTKPQAKHPWKRK